MKIRIWNFGWLRSTLIFVHKHDNLKGGITCILCYAIMLLFALNIWCRRRYRQYLMIVIAESQIICQECLILMIGVYLIWYFKWLFWDSINRISISLRHITTLNYYSFTLGFGTLLVRGLMHFQKIWKLNWFVFLP